MADLGGYTLVLDSNGACNGGGSPQVSNEPAELTAILSAATHVQHNVAVLTYHKVRWKTFLATGDWASNPRLRKLPSWLVSQAPSAGGQSR